MKLLMLCICLAVYAFDDTTVAKKQNDFYYFCSSTGNNQIADGGLQYILYTDIRQLPADTAMVKRMPFEWGNLVRKDCRNSNGCSSDLNIYESKAIAVAYLKKFKARYADEKKYKLVKMNFQ